MNKMDYKMKKPSESMKNIKSSAFKGSSKGSKSVDNGFYGHLCCTELKEDKQIVTSVDTIVEGC